MGKDRLIDSIETYLALGMQDCTYDVHQGRCNSGTAYKHAPKAAEAIGELVAHCITKATDPLIQQIELLEKKVTQLELARELQNLDAELTSPRTGAPKKKSQK